MRQTRAANSSGRNLNSRAAMRRNQNSVRFSADSAALGPISRTIVLALILSLMGLLYLTQITKQTSYGYEVNALEAQIADLKSEQKNLSVEAAILQAIERVEASPAVSDLTTPSSVEFADR